MMRIGHGFDSHRFSDDPNRRLMLGGVCVRDDNGLAGNSDADVVMHAATDAVLGALGLGDIGSYFDPTDAQWSDADSAQFLAFAVGKAREQGWQVQNIDCTVLAETPKLAPHRDAMVANMTALCAAPVNVKATTAEKMGAFGRGEGMACWAVALLTQEQPDSSLKLKSGNR